MEFLWHTGNIFDEVPKSESGMGCIREKF